MKTKIFTLFLALVSCVGTMVAQKIYVDDLCYNLNATKLTAEVTYKQDPQVYSSYSNLTTAEIPSSVAYQNKTYSVTSIGKDAFAKCSTLTSVTIPNSVTSIGESAFSSCSGLTSVVIPNSVTSIGIKAFMSCTSMTSVSIPSNLTSIEFQAFHNCSSLTSVTIPTTVTSIGRDAFSSCSSLTSITIPNSVTSIDMYAFAYCIGLTSVTCGNGVTSIGSYAFKDCNALTSVHISDIAAWCGIRFADANSNPLPIAHHLYLGDDEITELVIPDGATKIGAWAFDGCIGLTSVTIPGSVTTIEGYAFKNCFNAKTFICKGTTPSTLNNTNAFYGIGGFSIYVPCTSLEQYKTAVTWSNYASFIRYMHADNIVTSDSIMGSVNSPMGICGEITAIPNYGYHFTQWSDGNTDNPRTFDPSDENQYIAYFAIDRSGTCGDNLALTWQYDSDKKTLTISGTGDLTANKRYGLEADKEMTTLVIEDGVSIIGDSAFANIPTLSTVKIGKDVRKIQDYAFGNCYNLASIYNYRPTPATIVANTFEEVDKYACTLYVLPDSEEMYRSAVGWSDFYNILPIPASAIEEIISENSFTVSPQKIIDNGQLFILLSDGTRYSATGVKVE